MAASVASAREAYARRDWRAAYDGLARLPRPARHRRPRPPRRRRLVARRDAPSRWRSPRTSTSDWSPTGADAEAADRALRLALAWGDPRRPAGRHRLADPGRPAAPATCRRCAVHGVPRLPRRPPSTSTWPATRRRRRPRRSRSRRWPTSSTTPRSACFALALSGLAAVRRGATADGFALLDEAMLPVLAGRVDATVGRRHLLHRHPPVRRRSATWPGCGPGPRRWRAGPTRCPSTFMYAGVTRVHELQIISAEGDWDVVEEELGAPAATSLVGAHGWLSGDRLLRARGGTPAARRPRRRPGGVRPGPELRARPAARRGAAAARARAAPTAPWPQLRVSLAEREPARPGRAAAPPAVDLALETGDPAYAADAGRRAGGDRRRASAPPVCVARAAQARAAAAPRRR